MTHLLFSGWLENPAVKKQWCAFQKELRAARPRKPTLEQLVAELFKSNDSSVREQIWEWIDKAATRVLPVPVKKQSSRHVHYDVDVELYEARTTHPFLGSCTGAFSLFDFPDFQECLLKDGRVLASLLKGSACLHTGGESCLIYALGVIWLGIRGYSWWSVPCSTKRM